MVFDFKLGQRGAAIKTPIHGFQATVDKASFDHAFEGADFTRLVDGVHGAVGTLPIAQDAQSFEVFALLIDLLGGEGAAFGLHVVAAEFATMQLFDGVFDGQAMTVPPWNVLRVKTCQLTAFDDHVFEHFVERMPDVQLAVGVRRAVVQDKQRRTLTSKAQFFVQAVIAPAFGPCAFALGQIAAHRKRRVQHVERVAVIGFFSHG